MDEAAWPIPLHLSNENLGVLLHEVVDAPFVLGL